MIKNKLKLNFVDLILFILIFFTISALMASFFTKDGISELSAKEEYEVTVFIKNVPKEHSEDFVKDSILYTSNSEVYLGTVKNTRISPQSVVIDSGTYKSNDLYNISVVVKCNASLIDDRFSVNGVKIEKNSFIDISVPEYFAVGKVTNIKKVEI